MTVVREQGTDAVTASYLATRRFGFGLQARSTAALRRRQPATAHQGRRHMRTCSSRPVCRPPQSFHTRNGVLAAEHIQEVLVFSVQRSVCEQKANPIRSKVPLCGSATECVGHGPISITEREKNCNQGGQDDKPGQCGSVRKPERGWARKRRKHKERPAMGNNGKRMR